MKKYKFSELEYKANDFAQVQNKLNTFIDQIRSAGSLEAVLKVIYAHDALMEEVSLAYSLAYIRTSLDCTDGFYAQAVQHEGAGLAQLDSTAYYQALLESPFLPQLEEQFGPELRPRLEQAFRLNAAGHDLMAQAEVLSNRYQQKKAMLQVDFRGKTYSEGEMFALYDDPDRQTRIDARKAVSEAYLAQKQEFAPMLLELVKLRDGIAKANGFENYLEYVNASYHRRGYGEAEMAAFCQQVKRDLVPLLVDLQEEQRAALGLDKLMSYDTGLRFTDGNAVPAGDAAYLTEASKKIYDTISPAFGDFFRAMVETESLDVAASANKVAGMGFCNHFAKDYYPYVFGNCNGTLDDVTVFTHEIGHAWQGYLAAENMKLSILGDMPLDAVEIPSKTMELFTYPYAEAFFGKDAEKFRQGHFRDALREIAAYCAIHEFNTWIYTHVGASFEELVAKELEIEKLYYPDMDRGELEVYAIQGAELIRNMAVYMFPRYVISYSLSEMCAMELFRRSQTDAADAWVSYEKLCASGGSRSYPDTLAQAGLEPAYAEGSVKRVVDFAREYLGM